MKHLCVLGSGSFGTALAVSFCRLDKTDVTLWCRDKNVAETLRSSRENTTYLPGTLLPNTLNISTSIPENIDCFFWVIPVQHSLTALKDKLKDLPRNVPIVICSKGIEKNKKDFLCNIFKHEYDFEKIAILSGPNFAHEIAAGLPTATALACENDQLGSEITQMIGHQSLRPYLSNDIIGVEVCGALKNIMAIASGIVTGLELGQNARAALLSRGLIEIKRFGEALGAQPETFMGLAGVGDLTLTCQSEKSRNTSFGIRLAKGEKREELLNQKSVAEGVPTTKAVIEIAKEKNISVPICESVYNVLYNNVSIKEAMSALLARPFKEEF